ncbi:MAG TPA: transposase [Clostridiales bacterium]|nr:transposase [Clostridiales bacterium]
MLIIKPSKIYISSANVDMRKTIDGLLGSCKENMVVF